MFLKFYSRPRVAANRWIAGPDRQEPAAAGSGSPEVDRFRALPRAVRLDVESDLLPFG